MVMGGRKLEKFSMWNANMVNLVDKECNYSIIFEPTKS